MPINIFLGQKLFEHIEQLSDLMLWMGIAAKEIAISNKEDITLCFEPIRGNKPCLFWIWELFFLFSNRKHSQTKERSSNSPSIIVQNIDEIHQNQTYNKRG